MFQPYYESKRLKRPYLTGYCLAAMKTWQTLSIGILIGLVIGGGILLIATPRHSASIEYFVPTQASEITVSVQGSVNHPGIYTLPNSARINDAISAAGGALGGADLSLVNLADFLYDGEQVNLQSLQSSVISQTPSTQGKINLNQATMNELESLPGVGEEKAKAIINYREEYGSFVSIEDVLYVPGFGQSIFDSIQNLIDIK